MRCFYCKKKCIHIECKWCDHLYCSSCIRIEEHDCSGKDTCISFKREEMKQNLENASKCTGWKSYGRKLT